MGPHTIPGRIGLFGDVILFRQACRADRRPVRARATLTGLRAPESAGINIRIQVISFPDPFLRTLTNGPGVRLTFAGLPTEQFGIHLSLLCVRFHLGRLRFTLPCAVSAPPSRGRGGSQTRNGQTNLGAPLLCA